MEKCTFKVNELNRKTIYEGLRESVKVNYYWNSHGKFIPWDVDGKKSNIFKNTNVLVEEVEKKIESLNYSWVEWKVKVNGTEIDALDCCGYYTTPSGTLVFKMIVGEG